VRRVFWILALATLARATPGRADDGLPLDLTWNAPAECASAEDIKRELGRIARLRQGRTIARLSAHGRIDRVGTSYRLSLHTDQNGVAGERSLVAKECRSLAREVTLVLAVAFGEGVEIVNEPSQPTTADSQPEPSSASEGASRDASSQPASKASGTTQTPTANNAPEALRAEPPSAPAETAAPAEEAALISPSPSTPNRARLAGLLEGGVLFATLPAAAGVVAVGSELGVRRFWVEPRFEWIPRVGQTLDRGVRATYDGLGGSIAGCLSLPPYSVGLNACVGGEARALRGRSSGASESDKAVAPLASGLVSLGWEWPAHGAVGFRLDAALHVAFNRPHFIVEGLADVHQVPRLSPSLGAGVIFGKGR
jgi:hypothetical protein